MRRNNSREALAYIEKTGILGERRTQAYQCAWHHGPISTREIWERVKRVHPEIPQHSFTSRPSELEEMGVFLPVGDKKCQHTGRTVTLWDVTDHVPREPYHRKQAKEDGPTTQRLKDRVFHLEILVRQNNTTIEALRSEVHALREKLRRSGGEQKELF